MITPYESTIVMDIYTDNKPIKAGTFISYDGKRIVPYNGKNVFGLLANDIVSLPMSYWNSEEDLMKNKNIRVKIVKYGTVLLRMSPSLKIPMNQPIYVNPKTGKPTWRRIGPEIGVTLSSQDKDGYIKVRLSV